MKDINPSLIGLLFGCPLEQESEFCFFKELRKLSVEDRLAHIKSMTLAEQEALVANHKVCLCLQEMGLLPAEVCRFDSLYSQAV